jgi:hypothetical protein
MTWRGTMSDEETDFLDRLVRRFPMLSGAYAEHQSAFGEVLPHVFLYDVVVQAVNLFNQSTDAEGPNLRQEARAQLKAD